MQLLSTHEINKNEINKNYRDHCFRLGPKKLDRKSKWSHPFEFVYQQTESELLLGLIRNQNDQAKIPKQANCHDSKVLSALLPYTKSNLKQSEVNQ